MHFLTLLQHNALTRFCSLRFEVTSTHMLLEAVPKYSPEHRQLFKTSCIKVYSRSEFKDNFHTPKLL